MDFVSTLWLPIVLSGIGLFVASFLAWMVLPHHKGDWVKLPDESAFENAVGGLNLPPGNYTFPYCSGSADLKSEAFQRRMAEGPSGILALWDDVSTQRREPHVG